MRKLLIHTIATATVLWGSNTWAGCECPCHGDPVCDGVTDVLDVVAVIDIAFRGKPAVFDAGCPFAQVDVHYDNVLLNCDGIITVFDVLDIMNVAFSNGDCAVLYCHPNTVPCDPLPPPPVAPYGGGTVTVESRTFPTNQTDCKVGVYVKNVVGITGLTIPLEIRSGTPPAFTSSSSPMSWNLRPTSRLAAAWTSGARTKHFYGEPEVVNCCSGPISSSFKNPILATGPGMYITPDAVLFADASSGSAPPNQACLGAGADAPGNPTLELTFKAGSVGGFFEIDTCCVTPANHLLFVECGTNQPLHPAFTKGMITVIETSGEATIHAFQQSGGPFVAFTGIDPDAADSWTWQFGDGTGSTGQNPTHTYNSPGTYAVTAVATRAGNNYFASLSVVVNSIKADFSGTPRAGASPLAVDFTDLSTGGPTEWFWDFGDGNTSALQGPLTHTYTTNGWFAVSLRASNFANSSTREYIRYIHVGPAALPDLVVYLYGNRLPRPGIPKCYSIYLHNLGTADASGSTVQLEFPAQTTFVSSNPPGTPVGNTISWSTAAIPALAPAQTFVVCVNVPEGTLVGTELTATASVDAAPGEDELANNVDVENETVVASFDPNDKIVQPAGCGPNGNVTLGIEPLTYTIQFENKASATADAIYVLVVDTLDPNLDWGTLQIGPSIKDDVLSVSFNPTVGELTWFFNEIHLPPNVNPPEGEGFVAYSISPKPGLPNGTVISNRAHIRFDFNDWLAAPSAGPLSLIKYSTCGCSCPSQGDITDDGVIDVFDVIGLIDIAFSGGTDIHDAGCPRTRADVDNNGVPDVFDVIYLIATAFSGGPMPVDPCNP